MEAERSAAQGREREVLAKLVETLDDAHGTLNYYIGPGARVLYSTTTYDAIYGAVREAKELLADVN